MLQQYTYAHTVNKW